MGLKGGFAVLSVFVSVVLASKEVIDCRSVLEIADNSRTSNGYEQLSQRQPDAVFIMMNPGSSKPLVETDNRLHARSIHKLAISLVGLLILLLDLLMILLLVLLVLSENLLEGLKVYLEILILIYQKTLQQLLEN